MNAENGFSNALGRLVERRNGASFIRSTYDGDEVVFDDNNGTSFWYYANGPGIDNKLWFWPGQPMPVYVLKDHLGSTRGFMVASGQFMGPYNYDSFGKPLGTLPMRFAYAGREYDSDTELYYYRARWYDPQARRFISEDPIGLNGGINLYAYVQNNPMSYTDPFGLKKGDQAFGLPNKFGDWYHKKYKDGEPDIKSREDSEGTYDEWKKAGEPDGEGKRNNRKDRRYRSSDDGDSCEIDQNYGNLPLK